MTMREQVTEILAKRYGFEPSVEAVDLVLAGIAASACPDCGGETALGGLGPDGVEGAYDVSCTVCGWSMYVPEESKARTRIAALREIVRLHSAKRIDGYLVDAFTAGALVAIYDALSPAARERFGEPSLPRLVDFTWKNVSAR